VAEVGRTRWSDERIDDLALSVRDEIRELRRELRSEMRELRAEMHQGFRDLRVEVGDVRGEGALHRRLLLNLWATTVLGFVGLLVEISLR
jgi:hypothetical protein